MQVMTLSAKEVEMYVNPRELLDELEDGFRGLELGEVQSPPGRNCRLPGKVSPLRCQPGGPACS
jgi:alanine dehydrogenase